MHDVSFTTRRARDGGKLAVTSTAKVLICKASTKSGKPCRGWAVSGSEYCVAHDPASAGKMAAARRAGGKARHGRRIGSPDAAGSVKLATVTDVLGLLETTVNDVLKLENSLGRARAIAYLAHAWGALYESSELERRVAALEVKQNGGA